jgi:hypothetical protein
LKILKEEKKNSLSEMFHTKAEMDKTGGESSESEVISQTSQSLPSGLSSLPLRSLWEETTRHDGNVSWWMRN